MTHLGIVCVYLVDDGDEALLDLHFDRIEKHTRMPYVIYASVNRLQPKFKTRLERHPNVVICSCPDTQLRGYEEHAYYLDELIPAAFAGGASHVVLLNVDSFPIRDGWAESLIETLSETAPVAAVQRLENDDDKPHPSCLLFGKSFYENHRPRLLPTADERRSEAFARYTASHRVILDTGSGYGFRLFAEGLDWRPLVRSNRAEDHYIIGSVYDDVIFHLGGASRPTKEHIREQHVIDENKYRTKLRRAWVAALRGVATFVPLTVRRFVRPYLRLPSTRRAHQESQRVFDGIRSRLLSDPESYLEYLRRGEGSTPSGLGSA